MGVVGLVQSVVSDRLRGVAGAFQALEQSDLDRVFLRLATNGAEQLLQFRAAGEVSALNSMDQHGLAKLEQIAARSRPLVRAMNALIGLTGRRGLQQIVRNYGFSDTDHFWRLCEAQLAYQRRFAAALAAHRLDVVLAPACALPAWRHGATEELVVAGGYTVLYNLLGYPTGVVPFTKVRPDEESARPLSNDPMERTARATEEGSAGLPVGVQVIARPWREHMVLSTMTALESAGSATRVPSSRS